MNPRVAATIEKLKAFMAERDDALALPPEAARFVRAVALAAGAQRGLEIGTSYGYSGLWIASALAERGGTLITIDHDPRKVEAARSNFQAAGLAEVIDVRLGSALDILPTLDAEASAAPNTPGFDFALIDADKENCIRYVELLVPRLAPRAVILTDNTTSHAVQLAPFIEWIRGRDDFFSTHVPVGNGMELSVKRVVAPRPRGVLGA